MSQPGSPKNGELSEGDDQDQGGKPLKVAFSGTQKLVVREQERFKLMLGHDRSRQDVSHLEPFTHFRPSWDAGDRSILWHKEAPPPVPASGPNFKQAQANLNLSVSRHLKKGAEMILNKRAFGCLRDTFENDKGGLHQKCGAKNTNQRRGPRIVTLPHVAKS